MTNEHLPISCPHCQGKFHVAAAATIPDEQKLVMTIEHSAGPYIAATTLGDTITNTGKLLMAVAKEIGGKTAVMVEKVELEHGKAAIHFVILGVKS
jgi:hypothetical protein